MRTRKKFVGFDMEIKQKQILDSIVDRAHKHNIEITRSAILRSGARLGMIEFAKKLPPADQRQLVAYGLPLEVPNVET